MEEIKIEALKCPICGGNVFDAKSAKEKLYICTNKNANGTICEHMLCFCKACNKIYDESRFGKHGDVWECKECGNVCWSYTDRMRTKSQAQMLLNQMNNASNSFFNW